MNNDKMTNLLDQLRLAIGQQRDITEKIVGLYNEINIECGTLITVSLEQKIKQKPSAFGPDKNWVPPVATPESQYLRGHQLTTEKM